MSQPATIAWLAGHELTLAWRDWLALLTAGRRRKTRTVAIALIVFTVFMHLFAYWMVKGYIETEVVPDAQTLVGITGTLLLSWSLLLSQSMESVTRAFYTRSDLDLILSSPVSARKVFTVRMGRIALASVVVAVLLAAPFIDVLALRGGARWLGAYGVVAAMGAVATAAALALTVGLFRLIGAKRTRLIAQVVAAIVGAVFVIGLQILAIFSGGTMSRYAALQTPWMLSHAPSLESPFWWPARGVLGDAAAIAGVMAVSLILLCAAIALFSRRFGEHSLAAASVGSEAVRQRSAGWNVRARSPRRVLRQKEWTLIKRDPWLISQTLMQILYLLPPALLLWVTFRQGGDTYIVLVPVVVMAAGQLAGGLAWLTISGEDAPELVITAPISAASVLRAKVEAVLGMITLVFAPIVAGLTFNSVYGALVCAAGILAAAAAATVIQLCFRVQAKRSQFRRRQTSSRLATFAEAFSSIAWAATSAIAAGESWMALGPMAVALGILGGVWLIRPKS